ncbi:MAG TPA: CHAT domain-containing protein, partial [Coleofasciculaceae cyanobacterium]
MKAVVSRVSLVLAVIQLTGTLGTQPVQAQARNSKPDLADTSLISRGRTLQAQTTTPPTPPHLRALDQEEVTAAVPLIEQTWEKQFEDYFKTNFSDESTTVKNIAKTLGKSAKQTGKKPALIYMVPRPQQLELILITPEGQPIHKRVSAAKQDAIKSQLKELTQAILHPVSRDTKRYLPYSQQLYQWTIAPLEADLQAQGIDTLIFCVGGGLRSIPMAALHDGKQF